MEIMGIMMKILFIFWTFVLIFFLSQEKMKIGYWWDLLILSQGGIDYNAESKKTKMVTIENT